MTESTTAISHAKALNEKRLRVWDEAKTFLDDIERRGHEMSGEERAQWDRYNAEIERLDSERDVYLDREKREQESAAIRQAHPGIFGPGRGPDEGDTLRQFLRSEGFHAGARMEIPVAPAAKELRLLREGRDVHEARALAWDTGSVASAVPTSMARTLYQYLEASTSMLRAPTTKINTTSGEPLAFPTLAAHGIATQVSGQGTVIAGTDPTFAKTTLDAYKYGELCVVANEVLEDASIDVLDFLMRDLGRAVGRAVAPHLVTGTGTGQPRGVMTALAAGGGSVTTGGSLITPTYEKLIDLQYAVNDEYRMHNSVGWLMRDNTAGTIRKLRDGNGGTLGAALWQPSLTQGISGGEPDRLLGDPVYRDSGIASMASNARMMAYLDFSAYYVRSVGPVVIEKDTSRWFDTDQTGIRAKWRLDGDLLDTAAGVTMVQNV